MENFLQGENWRTGKDVALNLSLGQTLHFKLHCINFRLQCIMEALSPRTLKKRKSVSENVSKEICFHDAKLSAVLLSLWADAFLCTVHTLECQTAPRFIGPQEN